MLICINSCVFCFLLKIYHYISRQIDNRLNTVTYNKICNVNKRIYILQTTKDSNMCTLFPIYYDYV